MSVRIAPSVLAADFSRLGEEIAKVEAAGADLIHLDVMDGHFVPNLTMGTPVVKAVRKSTSLPLDVHLMITNPDDYIEMFVEAGASVIAVHAEVCPHLHRTIARIHELGAKASVAINPSTPVGTIADVATDLDVVLVMSVNPGFTGQAFIPHSLDKVAECRALLSQRASRADIQVDGGVSAANAGPLVRAGATILVAGAAVFHAADAAAAIGQLRQAAESR